MPSLNRSAYIQLYKCTRLHASNSRVDIRRRSSDISHDDQRLISNYFFQTFITGAEASRHIQRQSVPTANKYRRITLCIRRGISLHDCHGLAGDIVTYPYAGSADLVRCVRTTMSTKEILLRNPSLLNLCYGILRRFWGRAYNMPGIQVRLYLGTCNC